MEQKLNHTCNAISRFEIATRHIVYYERIQVGCTQMTVRYGASKMGFACKCLMCGRQCRCVLYNTNNMEQSTVTVN